MIRCSLTTLLGTSALLSAIAFTAPSLRAQAVAGGVEGVVRDAQKRPLAEVQVSLDEEIKGQGQSANTDAAGHFRFNEVPAGTYLLRFKKVGYLDARDGPFKVKRGETASLNLQMVEQNAGAPEKSGTQALEYSDEPRFTVAGVTDPSNLGGHGSNVTLPTKEALAKETATLATDSSSTNKTAVAKSPAAEFPGVSVSDFAQNLRVGKELLQAGRGKEAIPYLEQAAQSKPREYDASYFLALAYFRSGDAKRSGQLVQVLLAQGDRAELHALLGEVKEAAGQPLEAVKEDQRAAEMEPTEQHLFAWGAELLLHHAYEPASEVFAKGHRLHPKSIRMLVGLGATAYAQDLNEQAAGWFLEASDLNPADPRPYLFLGQVQEIAKSAPKEWLEAFQRFVTLQPDNALAHYHYAVALEKQRRGEEDFGAREVQLKKAIALDPQLGGAYLKLGVLAAEKDEIPSAVEFLKKAIEYTPLPDEAHFQLARAYRRMGQSEKAAKETELYNAVSARKKEQLARERHELGQFVYTMPGESTAAEKPAKPQ